MVAFDSRELQGLGQCARFVPIDVADEESVARAAEDVKAQATARETGRRHRLAGPEGFAQRPTR